uniref:Uncharacterized protein n=1 Tax=Craspedostauros australis TaxID=1486917 RepID=A0A7R9WNW6_9STRA
MTASRRTPARRIAPAACLAVLCLGLCLQPQRSFTADALVTPQVRPSRSFIHSSSSNVINNMINSNSNQQQQQRVHSMQTLRVMTSNIDEDNVANGNGNSNGNSSSSSNEDATTSVAATTTSEPSWKEILDSKMMLEVRQELIQKYLDQGISAQEAEVEVDLFLSDQERSEKYLEMRAYSVAQAEAGFETVLTLLAGFLIGFVGIVAPKYYAAYKTVYPDGGSGPIPFL